MDLEAERLALEEGVEWFLDYLKVERGASMHTLLAYSSDLGKAIHFFRALGVDSWTQIESPHLLRFETSLGPPLAKTTALRRVSSLRSLLKFLKRNDAGPPASLPSTGGFRKPKTLPKALSLEQLEAVLGAADPTRPNGLRDRALMELIYGAGLRVSEAVSAERADADLDGHAIRVTGKREKTRWVPLPAQTVSWLRKYLAEARPKLASRPSSLLILSDHGRAMRREQAYVTLTRLARKGGIEQKIGPHTLRHTYAVHLLKGGADLRALQELLGHESIATTQVYTQLDLEEVRKRYREAHPRS